MVHRIISAPTAALSRLASAKPIHTLVITALLGSVVYLSIIDDYISTDNAILQQGGDYSYYHGPAGSRDHENWSFVENLSEIDNRADHFAVIPLKFKAAHDVGVDKIEIHTSSSDESVVSLEQNDNEKLLVTPYADYEQALHNMNRLVGDEDNTVWSIRHSHRVSKYSEYIKQTLVRLQSIIKGAETYDILLIFFAYAAMWYTFAQIFVEFRKLGSRFWLAFGSLLSSGFAFLFALGFTNKVLGFKVSLRSLSEGIPFLVATIGFKHKVFYTEPILKATMINKKNSIPDIISDTVKITSWPLIRYHSIVIGAFLACSFYAPHLEGLRNFCILSSLILIGDLILTFTFYSAILALKAEINKVHASLDLKDFLEEDGISTDVAQLISEDPKLSIFHKNGTVVAFKIAIIVGFFGLHIFALGTSWLYDISDTGLVSFSDVSRNLQQAVSSHVKIGPHGTLITIMPAEIFTRVGYFTRFEDAVLNVWVKIGSAITDSFISKCLLTFAAISVTINIYFLNAARTHLDNIDTLASSASTASKAPVEGGSKKKQHRRRSEVAATVTPTSSSSSTAVTIGGKRVDNGAAVKESQLVETDYSSVSSSSSDDDSTDKIRPIGELVNLMKDGKLKSLRNTEVTSLVLNGKLPLYALEKQLGDTTRAVVVRRKAIAKLADAPVVDSDNLPYKFYDYDRVFGACCENVIGFIPLPLGVAGPLIIDGKPYHIPMATTEGCLVASAMRGCKAINAGGGVTTVLTQDGMTRGPCVSFPSLARAGACKMWLDSEEGSATVKKAFNSTSRFARLQSIKTAMAGTLLYIRFMTTTGDAMGMNMISKGVDHSLKYMIDECGWDDMEIISVSGNYCIDKKPAAINWIEGRGKSVVAEARIPPDVVAKVLKTNVTSLVKCNVNKNLIGSAMAGAMGGFNAQAANLVTAVYLATGQDPAQNVESSNCITLLDEAPNGDLVISVSMPSIEVGTIGGGTILGPQNAMLEMLGVKGANHENPGANAKQLAKIVASAVLSAELSLLSALEAGHLVQSHMQHNRKAAPAAAAAVPAQIQAPIPGSCIKS